MRGLPSHKDTFFNPSSSFPKEEARKRFLSLVNQKIKFFCFVSYKKRRVLAFYTLFPT